MSIEQATRGPRLSDRVAHGGGDGALRAGCYLLRFTRNPPLPGRYDGTLRVERDDLSAIASGDLYLHGSEPDPAAGVPVLARARYRSYVRVTQILEDPSTAARLTLGFELYAFDHSSNTWSNDGAFSARIDRTAAPDGYPSPGDFLRGAVSDASGGHVGELTMGWVSPHLRRAVIELDRVGGSEPPVANSAGLDWRAMFESIGWGVRVVESDAGLPEPSGESWSIAEMHAAMLARRDSANLDSEWRYWVVCVRRLDDDARGLMFDRDGGDSNNIPREAAGIASHWMIPDEDPWGLVKGMRFGSARDPYFRTAVHEIGHAMGLFHNTADNGIMCPTDVISQRAVAPQQFPENVAWSYAPKDQERLRHMPDHWVRPGGVPFGASFGTAPRLPDAAVVERDGLELAVAPLLPSVPIGAPVRVGITLRNADAETVPAPTDLSLKAGHVRGSVTDPSGTVRSFRSLVRDTEPRQMEGLARGDVRTGSLTLLRGVDGALFPSAGEHTVEVDVEWEIDGVPLRVAGAETVAVSPAVDDAHAEAAARIMSTPDTLIALALGGDHVEDGVAAIRAALANDVLQPHFAYIEAKRLASAFQHRSPDLAGAAELIDSSTVMSAAEIDKAARLLDTDMHADHAARRCVGRRDVRGSSGS